MMKRKKLDALLKQATQYEFRQYIGDCPEAKPVIADSRRPKRRLRTVLVLAALLLLVAGSICAVKITVYQTSVDTSGHQVQIHSGFSSPETKVLPSDKAYSYAIEQLGCPLLIPKDTGEMTLEISIEKDESQTAKLVKFDFESDKNMLRLVQAIDTSGYDTEMGSVVYGDLVAQDMLAIQDWLINIYIVEDNNEQSIFAKWYAEQEQGGGLHCTVSTTLPLEELKAFLKGLEWRSK